MNIKPAIKTYPAVFKTFAEAESFRLMPNAVLYTILKCRNMATKRIEFKILYVEGVTK